jgi:hypothetical protein
LNLLFPRADIPIPADCNFRIERSVTKQVFRLGRCFRLCTVLIFRAADFGQHRWKQEYSGLCALLDRTADTIGAL